MPCDAQTPRTSSKWKRWTSCIHHPLTKDRLGESEVHGRRLGTIARTTRRKRRARSAQHRGQTNLFCGHPLVSECGRVNTATERCGHPSPAAPRGQSSSLSLCLSDRPWLSSAILGAMCQLYGDDNTTPDEDPPRFGQLSLAQWSPNPTTTVTTPPSTPHSTPLTARSSWRLPQGPLVVQPPPS